MKQSFQIWSLYNLFNFSKMGIIFFLVYVVCYIILRSFCFGK